MVTLGDVTVDVYRPNQHVGVKSIWTSPSGRVGLVPAQAALLRFADLSTKYVDHIFSQAVVRVIDIKRNDTILIYSDGVLDNVGPAQLLNTVGKAYHEWNTDRKEPDDLARDIVNLALTGAGTSGGKPDDTSIVVGYICETE